MSEDRKTVDSLARAKFGMSGEQYIRNRVQQGYTAGQMATELGVSRMTANKHVRKVATPNPRPWLMKNKAA